LVMAEMLERWRMRSKDLGQLRRAARRGRQNDYFAEICLRASNGLRVCRR
jgi:hypothetical protein